MTTFFSIIFVLLSYIASVHLGALEALTTFFIGIYLQKYLMPILNNRLSNEQKSQ